jgi:hypothetical protein
MNDSQRLAFIVKQRYSVKDYYRVMQVGSSVQVFFVIDEDDNVVAEGSTYKHAH